MIYATFIGVRITAAKTRVNLRNIILTVNFKNINVSPNEIAEEIIEISQVNGLRFSEHILPYCRKSIKAKREESNIRRLTLYKSGKTFGKKNKCLKPKILAINQNSLVC